MYDYIKGNITSKTALPRGFFVTVETFGLGYLLEVTGRDFSNVENGEAKIYTVLIHKEDKMSLCGFIRKEDRDIFNVLTSVSGVGTKMALTLLDKFSASELIGLVIDGNYKDLTLAKGVGPKLAQKIILELKDKLINYQKDWSAPNFVEKVREENSNLVDAQSVLLSFGYEKNEIKSAFAKLELGESASAEEIKELIVSAMAYHYTQQDEVLDLYAIKKQIEEYDKRFDEVIILQERASGDKSKYETELKKLSSQMLALKDRLKAAEEMAKVNTATNYQLERIRELFAGEDNFAEYNDKVVRVLVENIRVMSDQSIMIVLKGGYTIREHVEDRPRKERNISA